MTEEANKNIRDFIFELLIFYISEPPNLDNLEVDVLLKLYIETFKRYCKFINDTKDLRNNLYKILKNIYNKKDLLEILNLIKIYVSEELYKLVLYLQKCLILTAQKTINDKRETEIARFFKIMFAEDNGIIDYKLMSDALNKNMYNKYSKNNKEIFKKEFIENIIERINQKLNTQIDLNKLKAEIGISNNSNNSSNVVNTKSFNINEFSELTKDNNLSVYDAIRLFLRNNNQSGGVKGQYNSLKFNEDSTDEEENEVKAEANGKSVEEENEVKAEANGKSVEEENEVKAEANGESVEEVSEQNAEANGKKVLKK